MLDNFKGFLNIFSVVKQVFTRFPVAFVFVLLMTLISILQVHSVEIFSKDILAKLYLVMGFGALAHVGYKLFVENKNVSLGKYILGIITLTFIVIFYAIVLFDKAAFTSMLFFSLALGLGWMFTPYINSSSDENSVWFFNYQTGVAIFFAAIASIIFGGGLSLILVSIGYLFEVDIEPLLYADIWIVTWGVLFTSYVLANISKVYDFEDEGCEFPKGISFIANYILVPLMYAYVAVLYAYFVKIILQWELPKGNLVWMISAFGIIGLVTKLLAYPIRNKGTRLMLLFDRYFYYVLTLPVLMLFVAIYIRINEYGVTEQRYAVVLLGLLFLFTIAAAIFKKEQFHIKHVPMILAVLALLASYGPWSISDVSFHSQLERFTTLLKKYKRLANGQAVRSTRDISFEDRKTISSIADYLVGNKWRKKQVTPMFDTLLAEENEKKGKPKYVSSRTFLKLLNIEYVGSWQKNNKNNVKQFNYSNRINLNKYMIEVSGYDFIGRNNFYLYNTDKARHHFDVTRNNHIKKVKVNFTSNIIQVNIADKYYFKFDLNEKINLLQKQGINAITNETADHLIFTGTSTDKKVRVKMLIEQMNGQVTGKRKNKCNTVNYVLMLDFND